MADDAGQTQSMTPAARGRAAGWRIAALAAVAGPSALAAQPAVVPRPVLAAACGLAVSAQLAARAVTHGEEEVTVHRMMFSGARRPQPPGFRIVDYEVRHRGAKPPAGVDPIARTITCAGSSTSASPRARPSSA